MFKWLIIKVVYKIFYLLWLYIKMMKDVNVFKKTKNVREKILSYIDNH